MKAEIEYEQKMETIVQSKIMRKVIHKQIATIEAILKDSVWQNYLIF